MQKNSRYDDAMLLLNLKNNNAFNYTAKPYKCMRCDFIAKFPQYINTHVYWSHPEHHKSYGISSKKKNRISTRYRKR